MTGEHAEVAAGLEGVVVAATRLSRVDGEAGELLIAGYPVDEIAGRVTFEQMTHLLLEDRVPNEQEASQLREQLAAVRELPEITKTVVDQAAADGVAPMDALRMAVGTLPVRDDAQQQAREIIAKIPTAIARHWRRQQGQEPVEVRTDLSHAASFLWMLTGEEPSSAKERGLETYLNTVIDHGFNASTFTARVITSTGSDLVSAIVGAIGALKGPLHGGAPGPALDMVFEIGQIERAEAFLREKLDRGERLMGFGHRVYKVRDPRAEVLSQAAHKLFEGDGDRAIFELAQGVEKKAVELLEEYKPGRRLQTNVEFYTALLLHGLDLPVALFTPVFALSRCVGWLAHSFEQHAEGRLIRPKAHYAGAVGRKL